MGWTSIVTLAGFAKFGIEPGKPWDAAKIDPAELAAIDQGVEDAKVEMAQVAKTTLSQNGLFGTREFLKNDYMKRAMGAEKGLYGNSLEEAWYGGFVGDGTKQTMLHFPPGQLPPAKFFWSLTLYTLPDRFLYANPLNRYSIGDRTKGLVYGRDQSLTIYLGHTSPSTGKESNWLPRRTASTASSGASTGRRKLRWTGPESCPCPWTPSSPRLLRNGHQHQQQ